MAKKKTLSGTEASDWLGHKVEFRYKGKAYTSPIEGNLVLNDMSVGEIKKHLNEVPGRYSYWKSFAVQVEREIFDLEEDFEMWFQKAYMEIDTEFAGLKKTESWKKSKVMLDNADNYRTRRAAIRDLRDAASQIGALTAGYNTMAWTLREIARLTYGEMTNIELRGRGNLSDIKG